MVCITDVDDIFEKFDYRLSELLWRFLPLKINNETEMKIKIIILPHNEADNTAAVDNGSGSTNHAQKLKTINSIKKQRK